jgi:HD-GYP domain-containing protein (c-di-GMP phosphodiesterase class II)
MLAVALDERDSYTHGHSDRVRKWALTIGKKMGLEGRELDDLGTGAILHDIGKIGIEDNILRKPGPLLPDERAKIETHPLRGEQIISPVKELHPIIPIVRNHHERPDGAGYPSRLKDIPLAARIVAVVDTYDAMVSARPYRPAMKPEDARRILREVAGTQLDEEIVNIFLDCLAGEESPDMRAARPAQV